MSHTINHTIIHTIIDFEHEAGPAWRASQTRRRVEVFMQEESSGENRVFGQPAGQPVSRPAIHYNSFHYNSLQFITIHYSQ